MGNGGNYRQYKAEAQGALKKSFHSSVFSITASLVLFPSTEVNGPHHPFPEALKHAFTFMAFVFKGKVLCQCFVENGREREKSISQTKRISLRD